jgi:hypothetical protein
VRLISSGVLVELRTGAIVLLKLSTLMRSGDVAACLPTLYEHGGQIYVRTVVKGGIGRSFSLTGATLIAIARWCVLTKLLPTRTLFTGLVDKCLSLGSERIAKLSLGVMAACGLEPKMFKSHALRGAAACAALLRGTPEVLVRHRGGWSSGATLDQYYGRGHQQVSWEQPSSTPPTTTTANGVSVGVGENAARVHQSEAGPDPPHPDGLPYGVDGLRKTELGGRGRRGEGPGSHADSHDTHSLHSHARASLTHTLHASAGGDLASPPASRALHSEGVGGVMTPNPARAPPAPSPGADADSELEANLQQLRDRGCLVPLGAEFLCVACSNTVRWEPSYQCITCARRCHIGCGMVCPCVDLSCRPPELDEFGNDVKLPAIYNKFSASAVSLHKKKRTPGTPATMATAKRGRARRAG